MADLAAAEEAVVIVVAAEASHRAVDVVVLLVAEVADEAVSVIAVDEEVAVVLPVVDVVLHEAARGVEEEVPVVEPRSSSSLIATPVSSLPVERKIS